MKIIPISHVSVSTHFCLFKTVGPWPGPWPAPLPLYRWAGRSATEVTVWPFTFRFAEGTTDHLRIFTLLWWISHENSQWYFPNEESFCLCILVEEKKKSRENLFSCTWNYLQNNTAQGAWASFSQDLFTSCVGWAGFPSSNTFYSTSQRGSFFYSCICFP